MAFIKKQLALLSTGVNVDGTQWWSYETADDYATVTASAYFNEMAEFFNVDHVVYVKTSDHTGLIKISSARGVTPVTSVSFSGDAFAGTSAFAGGGTTHPITVTGMLATDLPFVQIQASTNTVSIAKVTPTADTITVEFSADPGAATVLSYHVIKP